MQAHIALKRDFEAARRRDIEVSAGSLAVEFDKSVEWVYALMRGEIAITLNVAIRWARLTGGRHFLGWLENELGIICVPRPSNGDATVGELADEICAHADMVRELAELYADGRIDASEASKEEQAKVEHLCEQTVSTTLALLEKYRADAVRARNGRARTMKEAG